VGPAAGDVARARRVQGRVPPRRAPRRGWLLHGDAGAVRAERGGLRRGLVEVGPVGGGVLGCGRVSSNMRGRWGW